VGTVFPPAIFVVPVMLPIISLGLRIVKEGFRYVAEEREKEMISCQKAQVSLQKVTQDLAILRDSVNAYVQWWAEVDLVLAGIETQMTELRTKGRPLVDPIKEQFLDTKERYQDYKNNISQFQDALMPRGEVLALKSSRLSKMIRWRLKK